MRDALRGKSTVRRGGYGMSWCTRVEVLIYDVREGVLWGRLAH